MENSNNPWLDRWNDRYRQAEYAYGEEPNNYLKEQLGKLTAGSILFPAEGEGRNAVYAAKLGWNVSAFDISIEGKLKAMQLAQKQHVSIDYQVGSLETTSYNQDQFDAIALIYAHFPAELKSHYHSTFDKLLKPQGVIIFEAFSKKNLEYVKVNEKIGGPKDIDVLCSKEEILRDFPKYECIELEEMEVELHEGKYHNGIGAVVRFLGRKK
jgi:2-polyprenyl-3-methyl-5-hydroxy-6-metoxy-1,4-benzoquinol methylase